MKRPFMHYFWWFIYWAFLIISFCVVGFVLVAKATGYRYNTNVGRWQKTAMLIVDVDPRESLLTIDSKEYPVGQSTRIPNILPGTYKVTVRRNQYLTWTESITFKPGYVINVDPITLFYDKPIEVATNPNDAEDLAAARPDLRVRILDNELWYENSLVSRFADTPSAAILHPDRNHIIYVLGKSIKIIEINGTNDMTIFERSSDQETPLVLRGSDTLLFKDGETVRQLKIR